jgi:hypothetical protein
MVSSWGKKRVANHCTNKIIQYTMKKVEGEVQMTLHKTFLNCKIWMGLNLDAAKLLRMWS